MTPQQQYAGGGSLVRSVSWNYAGYFVELAAGVLLLAYVVRRVSVADYGIYLLAQSIAAFLYILDFGLSNVLVQLYVSVCKNRGMAEVSRLASTLFVALLGIGLLGATVVSLAALAVPQWMRAPSAQAELAVRVLAVAAFTVPLVMPGMALEHLCQAFHRFDRVNQVQIAMVVLRVGLTVEALQLGKGILGLAAVQAAVAGARLLGLWTAARAGIGGLSFDLRHFEGFRVIEAVRASGWAFGDDLSRRIGMNAESMVLAGLGSFTQVALFGMGGKLPAHLYQLAVRGLSVLMPTLSRQYHEGDTARLRETYTRALQLALSGMLPIVVFACICSRQLVEVWAGPAYRAAGPVLAWLLLLALSQVVEFPSDLVLYSHDRIRRAARFSVVETAGKVALALALARPFGAAGVAAGIALWHWCVNLGGYLPEACRVAQMRAGELWRVALFEGDGQGTLLALFAGGAALLFIASRHLPALAVFAACVAVSATYAGVWMARMVRPLAMVQSLKLSNFQS